MSAATDIQAVVQAKAAEHLLAQGKEATTEAVENQGKWLFALFHAAALQEADGFEGIVSLLLNGVKPIGSVLEECEALLDPNPLEDQSAEFLDWLELLS